MTCAEFKELAAVLALGALDPTERAAAEAHLAEASHEGCFEALQQASAGMEALARTLPAPRPDAGIWRVIEARVAPGSGIGPRDTFSTYARFLSWAAAVAAVFVLFAAGARERRLHAAAVASVEREKQQCLGELSSLRGEAEAQRSAIALLQSPTTQVVSFAPQPSGGGLGARALVDLAARKAMVLSSALAPRAGKDFELWIIRGKEAPVPAGLLRAGQSGTVLASIDPQLLAGGADALAVSVEPAGGSPTGAPTGDVVLVGALPKS